jgi:hypothetical protein
MAGWTKVGAAELGGMIKVDEGRPRVLWELSKTEARDLARFLQAQEHDAARNDAQLLRRASELLDGSR